MRTAINVVLPLFAAPLAVALSASASGGAPTVEKATTAGPVLEGGFEGRVDAKVTTFLEVFEPRPSLVRDEETARVWITRDAQRIERGKAGASKSISLERRAGGSPHYSCRLIERACFPYGSAPAQRWKVEHTGRSTVAGVACDVVRAESPGVQVELCTTEELGPGGIWLREFVPAGAEMERALTAAGLGSFPLRVRVWQGRPQQEMEVASIAREVLPASRFDLPDGCVLMP